LFIYGKDRPLLYFHFVLGVWVYIYGIKIYKVVGKFDKTRLNTVTEDRKLNQDIYGDLRRVSLK